MTPRSVNRTSIHDERCNSNLIYRENVLQFLSGSSSLLYRPTTNQTKPESDQEIKWSDLFHFILFRTSRETISFMYIPQQS